MHTILVAAVVTLLAIAGAASFAFVAVGWSDGHRQLKLGIPPEYDPYDDDW